MQAAKATGFSSVSEMLLIKGYDNLDQEKKIAKDVAALPKKSLTLKKAIKCTCYFGSFIKCSKSRFLGFLEQLRYKFMLLTGV